jgi:hypothetical protein
MLDRVRLSLRLPRALVAEMRKQATLDGMNQVAASDVARDVAVEARELPRADS